MSRMQQSAQTVSCRLCGRSLPTFHVFPRRALFNKPLKAALPEACADMELSYCPDCRHISSHLATQMSAEALQHAVYGELYATYAPVGLSPSQKNYMDFVAAWLAPVLPQQSRVLEIGCHDGYFLSRIQDLGHTCEGIEPSANARLGKERYGLDVRHDFFQDGQYKPETYDLVIVRHVLEHVDDPVSFATAAARLIKKGGLFYCEVPNSYWSLTEPFFPEFHADHLSYFTLPSALHLLRLAGLGSILHAEAAAAYMRFPFLNILAANDGQPPAAMPWFMDFKIVDQINQFTQLDRNYREKLRNAVDGARLAVWGTGSIGTQFAIDGALPQSVRYVDPNPAVHGLQLSVTGHPVFPPESLREMGCDRLILASGWEADARKQALPFVASSTEILTFKDLLR